MSVLKALVVDDESNARENLAMLVEEYCADAKIVAKASSADEARSAINAFNPDLVFLDINMPEEDGFQFLQSVPDRKFAVIFTTAHNEYALKAFKANAVDYLEKPLSIEDLKTSVTKVHKMRSASGISEDKVRTIVEQMLVEFKQEKIGIPTNKGVRFLMPESIVHLESGAGNTVIHTDNGDQIVSIRRIKFFEDSLSDKMFMRVHRSHIINFKHHLMGMIHFRPTLVKLSNGKEIPISRNKKREVCDLIGVEDFD